MAMIIGAVIFLIAFIGFGLIMKHFREKSLKISAQPQTPPPPSKSPEEEFKEILDSLLNLNMMIRKDPDLDEKITRQIEIIIDDLKAVIPAMMERYPAETLTYELKKIGLAHLFKTVKEYLDLSLESRQTQSGVFKNIIQSLHDVSNRSRDIVEKNETAEFKTMAHFLAGKFS